MLVLVLTCRMPCCVCRMADALGDGIFNTDGHSWWLQRKAVSRIFSEAAFQHCMEQVFTEKMGHLKDRCAAGKSRGACRNAILTHLPGCKTVNRPQTGLAGPAFACWCGYLAAATARRLSAAAASGSPVDLHELLHRYTFDAFCSLAMGFEPDCLKEGGRMQEMEAFHRMTNVLCARWYLFFFKITELLTPSGAGPTLRSSRHGGMHASSYSHFGFVAP